MNSDLGEKLLEAGVRLLSRQLESRENNKENEKEDSSAGKKVMPQMFLRQILIKARLGGFTNQGGGYSLMGYYMCVYFINEQRALFHKFRGEAEDKTFTVSAVY